MCQSLSPQAVRRGTSASEVGASPVTLSAGGAAGFSASASANTISFSEASPEGDYTITVTCEGATHDITLHVVDPEIPDGFDGSGQDYNKEVVKGGTYEWPAIFPVGSTVVPDTANPSWAHMVSSDAGIVGFSVHPADTGTVIMTVDGVEFHFNFTAVDFTIEDFTVTSGGSRTVTAIGGTVEHTVDVTSAEVLPSGMTVTASGSDVSVAGAVTGTYHLTVTSEGASKQVVLTVQGPNLPGFEPDGSTFSREIVRGGTYTFTDVVPESSVLTVDSSAPAWAHVDGAGNGITLENAAAGETETSYSVTFYCDGAEYTLSLTVVDLTASDMTLIEGGSATFTAVSGNSAHTVETATGTPSWITASGGTVSISDAVVSDDPYFVTLTCEGASASFFLTVVAAETPDGFTETDENTYDRELVLGGSYEFNDLLPAGCTITADDFTTNDLGAAVTANGRGFSLTNVTEEGTVAFACDNVTFTYNFTVTDFTVDEISVMTGGGRENIEVINSNHVLDANVTVIDAADFSVTASANTISFSGASPEGDYTITVTCEGATHDITLHVTDPEIPDGFDPSGTNTWTKDLVKTGTYTFEDIAPEGSVLENMNQISGSFTVGLTDDVRGFTITNADEGTVTFTCDGVTLKFVFTATDFTLTDITISTGGSRNVQAIGGGHVLSSATVSGGTTSVTYSGGAVVIIDAGPVDTYDLTVVSEGVSKTVTLTVRDNAIPVGPGDFTDDGDNHYHKELVLGGSYDYDMFATAPALAEGYELRTGFTLTGDGMQISGFDSFTDSYVLAVVVSGITYTFTFTVTDFDLTDFGMPMGSSKTVTAITGDGTHSLTSASISGGTTAVTCSGADVRLTNAGPDGTYQLTVVCEGAEKTVTVTVVDFNVPDTDPDADNCGATFRAVRGGDYTFDSIVTDHTLSLTSYPEGWTVALSGTDGIAITDAAAGTSDASGDIGLTADGAVYTLHIIVDDFVLQDIGIALGGNNTYEAIGHGHELESATPSGGTTVASVSGGNVLLSEAGPEGTYQLTVVCEGASKTVTLTVSGPNIPGGGETTEGDETIYTKEVVAGGRYHFEDVFPSAIQSISGNEDGWIETDGTNGIFVEPTGTGNTSVTFTLVADNASFKVRVTAVDFTVDTVFNIIVDGTRTTADVLPAGHTFEVVGGDGAVVQNGNALKIVGVAAGSHQATLKCTDAYAVPGREASKTVMVVVTAPDLPDEFTPEGDNTYSVELVEGSTRNFSNIVPEGTVMSLSSDGTGSVSLLTNGRGISFTAIGNEGDVVLTADHVTITVHVTVAWWTVGPVTMAEDASDTIAVLDADSVHHVRVDSPDVNWISDGDNAISVTSAVMGEYTVQVSCDGVVKSFVLTVTGINLPDWMEEIAENEYRGVLVTGGSYRFSNIISGEDIAVSGTSWATADGADLLMHPDMRGQYTVTVTAEGTQLTLHLEVRDLVFGRYVIPDGGDLEIPGLVPEGHTITDIAGPHFALISGEGISIRGADSGTWVITYWCDGAHAQIDLRVVGFGIDDVIYTHPGEHIELPEITDGAIDIEGPDWVAPDDHGTGMVIDVGNTTGSYDVVITSEGVTKSIRIIVTDDTSSGGDFGSFLLLAILIAILISITVYATVRDYKKRQQMQP
jgi:hypothetical protein